MSPDSASTEPASPEPASTEPANTVHLGDLGDLQNGQLRVFADIGEHGVVVCRVDGVLCAVVDNCSHRDAKLSEGRLRGSLLTCPLHGAQFDVRTGAQQGPPATVPIECFAVQESEEGAYLEIPR